MCIRDSLYHLMVAAAALADLVLFSGSGAGSLHHDPITHVVVQGLSLIHIFNVLETITLDKESSHFKAQLAQKYADIVYNGQWFTPLREALDAFADSLEKTVTGDVKLKLYKGNMINAGVTSPYTLYDEQTASFGEDEDYNQADATGFINLFGLSIKERAKLSKNWPEVK